MLKKLGGETHIGSPPIGAGYLGFISVQDLWKQHWHVGGTCSQGIWNRFWRGPCPRLIQKDAVLRHFEKTLGFAQT